MQFFKSSGGGHNEMSEWGCGGRQKSSMLPTAILLKSTK
ncbi:hypothetical protein NMH_0577 [Neisseria meningitidis H44/76]|uniref:Uncharacterized protein n=1 Tax=Neisseria meningitidis serogroup B / serotype 15 (strain H44/76) TaxID=909420 RepID=E6MUY2_NEIMH|nr:hypothetical protein NMH_0577 [Neisseria meningitidis H44/76]